MYKHRAGYKIIKVCVWLLSSETGCQCKWIVEVFPNLHPLRAESQLPCALAITLKGPAIGQRLAQYIHLSPSTSTTAKLLKTSQVEFLQQVQITFHNSYLCICCFLAVHKSGSIT